MMVHMKKVRMGFAERERGRNKGRGNMRRIKISVSSYGVAISAVAQEELESTLDVKGWWCRQ